MSWVRFTVAAGTPSRYAEIMYKDSTHTEVFDNAMTNIKYAVDLKKRLGLKVTLGIQMVLMPQFKDEIIPFAQLGVDQVLTMPLSSIVLMTRKVVWGLITINMRTCTKTWLRLSL